MVVNVGDDQDASGSLLLGREHLAQRERGLGHHQAVERACGIVFTWLVREDQDELPIDVPALIIVMSASRIADSESSENQLGSHFRRATEGKRNEILAKAKPEVEARRTQACSMRRSSRSRAETAESTTRRVPSSSAPAARIATR